MILHNVGRRRQTTQMQMLRSVRLIRLFDGMETLSHLNYDFVSSPDNTARF